MTAPERIEDDQLRRLIDNHKSGRDLNTKGFTGLELKAEQLAEEVLTLRAQADRLAETLRPIADWADMKSGKGLSGLVLIPQGMLIEARDALAEYEAGK